MDWNKLADNQAIENTANALKNNGIDVVVVENGQDAKQKVLELLPKGAEVFNTTSITLDTLNLTKEIMESDNYDAVKSKLLSMDRKTQGLEMQKLGAAPEWVIGSVHAVTEKGQVLIASNSGSQLSPYAYAASHVVWVVGAQKLVKDLDSGIKRIYEYSLPLESARARKAYGLREDWQSFVSKILIVNKEVKPGRITMLIVKEKLGF